TSDALTVNVSSGSLVLAGANRLASGAVLSLNGGTLDSGANATTVTVLNLNSGIVTGPGVLTAGNYNLGGGTVAGALGTGVADVSGSVALSGTTMATNLNINAGGVLTLMSSDRIGDATVLDVNNGRLALGVSSDTAGALTLRNGASLTGTGVLTAATYALQGGTVDAGLGLGAATVSLGTTTLNGTLAALSVDIQSGTLWLGGVNRLASGATVLVSGGVLNSDSFANAIETLNLSSGLVSGGGTLTAATYGLSGGVVSGNLGAGTANVTGAVSLIGTMAADALNINAGGVLTLGTSNRISDTTSLSVNGGELALGSNNETVGAVSLVSGRISGSGTLTGLSYALQSGSVFAALGGAGVALTKSGGGEVVLMAANQYTGATNVTAGSLTLVGTASIAGLSVGVDSGATLNLSGSTSLAGATALNADGTVNLSTAAQTMATLTGAGLLYLNGAALTVGNGNFSGSIAGSGSLLKETTGTLTLGGSNTFSGSATVAAGSLSLISGGSIGSTSLAVYSGASLVVASGAALNTAAELSLDGTARFGGAAVLASLNGASSGVLQLAGTELTLSNGAFAGALVDAGGAGSLVKAGAGLLSLTGANTFSGALSVAAGVLSLAGTGSLATTALNIAAGGTLTVAAAASLSSQAALVADGVVNFNADLALQSLTGVGRVNLNSTALTLGNGNFSGVLADGTAAGSLVKVGSGLLTLGGA
ncbi:MAG: hypothetical protein EBS01_12295, partial [Verrucomicrobia bacterium]|nr:hypothetical protein [Verrucomicrobiota bacterium]